MKNPLKRNSLRILVKTLVWSFGIVVALILVLLVVLSLPPTQRFLTHKAETYLGDKIKSKVRIEEIGVSFPKFIHLKNIYLEDRDQDTLFSCRSLKIDISLWALFSKEVNISAIEIEGSTAHIKRAIGDSTFNYSFIPQAFSSPAAPKAKTSPTARPWTFFLGSLRLKDIFLTWHDEEGGLKANLHLGKLEADVEILNLPGRKILFSNILLHETRFAMVQTPSRIVSRDTSTSAPFDIGLSELVLSKVNVSMIDSSKGVNLDLGLGKLTALVNKLDLLNQIVDLNSVNLSDTKFGLRTRKVLDKSGTVPSGGPASIVPSWVLSLKKLELSGNTFSFDATDKKPKEQGVDYSHLFVSNITAGAKNIFVGGKLIKVDLDQLMLEERCGLVLKKFKTQFTYDSTHLELADLDLETGRSHLSNFLSVSFPSQQAFQDSLSSLLFKADLKNTVIGLNDILLFKPDILDSSIFNNNVLTQIRLNALVDGTLAKLQVHRFELSTQQHTRVVFQGELKNMLKPSSFYADIGLKEFSTALNDLNALLKPAAFPKSIQVPALINLSGNFKGSLKEFVANAELLSSSGSLSADLIVDTLTGKGQPHYDLNARAASLDLGAILKQPGILGPVTFTATAVGQGLDTNTLKATLSICADSAFFKGYVYNSLTLDGQLEKQSFLGNVNLNDKNMVFNLNANFDAGQHPHYLCNLDLKGAELGALGFTKEGIRISALLTSDLKSAPGKNMTGKVRMVNGLMIKDNRRQPIDSIVLQSKYTDEGAELSLRSSFMRGDFKGNLNLSELPASFSKLIKYYFNPGESISVEHLQAQDFQFSLTLLHQDPFTALFLPDLTKLKSAYIKGSFNSEANQLSLDAGVPQFAYQGILVDSLKIKFNSDAQQMNYAIHLTELSDSLVKIVNMVLKGNIKQNNIAFSLQTSKRDQSEMISLGGNLKTKGNNYELRFDPEFVLNKKRWVMDQHNYLLWGTREFNAHEIMLREGDQEISLSSKDSSGHSPLNLKFRNLEIFEFSQIIENDRTLVTGVLEGEVIIKDQNKRAAFTSDISLKDFTLLDKPIGTITLHSDNEKSVDQYALKLLLKGNENDLSLDGNYTAGVKANNLHFNLDIRNLNPASAEPFLSGNVTRLSGGVSGSMVITGNAESPGLQGSLQLTKCSLKPAILNSLLMIPEGKLLFTPGRVQFSSFTLLDSLNHKAALSGYADLHDFSNIAFDLKMKTTNFLALNTTVKDNPLYFGTVYLDSDIHLHGTPDAPVADVVMRLNKGTSITYVNPADAGVTEESKGVVEFVDTANAFSLQKNIMTRKNAVEEKKKNVTGIQLNAVIAIDKATKLKIIVDPSSGDSLIVIGSAQLTFTLDPNGRTSLNGRYKLNDGSYHLAMDEVIRRNFKIESGGTITWSGDVMDADVELSAVYKVHTSPLDLVQSQLAGMSEAQKNAFRQNLNFLVYLKMSGPITRPDLHFDIKLPTDQVSSLNGTVTARLEQLRTDETEMNKQVFALLALNRFLAEDPLDNSGGNTALSSTARSSAGKLLSDQLNTFSGKYIKGVDLNLGVESYEDFSTGQGQERTQVQMALSKNLFDSKVTVKVGGNVDVEGERAKQNNASDVAGNVDIQYKLTTDGTYKLKGFRQNDYLNPIEGEITKTGVGVIFTKDFNRIKELFRKSESLED